MRKVILLIFAVLVFLVAKLSSLIMLYSPPDNIVHPFEASIIIFGRAIFISLFLYSFRANSRVWKWICGVFILCFLYDSVVMGLIFYLDESIAPFYNKADILISTLSALIAICSVFFFLKREYLGVENEK